MSYNFAVEHAARSHSLARGCSSRRWAQPRHDGAGAMQAEEMNA